MVCPVEIRAILARTRLSWQEVAEPYPEEIILPSGTRCTFEWALRRTNGRCMFLEEDRCGIYAVRPWICRTYPFLLSGRVVEHSACPGIGCDMNTPDAYAIARDLLSRREAELEEEDRIRCHSRDIAALKGRHLLIDGEGVIILEP